MSDQLEDTNIGSCYAHISNGGVSYDLIKRDNDDPDNPGSYFFLSVGVSNHGHTCSTTIPLNKDSVKSLLYILAANQLMIESKDIDNLIKAWLPHIEIIDPIDYKEQITTELQNYLDNTISNDFMLS